MKILFRTSAVNAALALLLAMLALGFPSAYAQKQMAITIDDLPIAYSRGLSLEDQQAAFNGILAALKKHEVTAAGFANGQRIKPEWSAYLDAWVAAGHVLGNHTYSHPDLNSLSVKSYTRNIERGEKSIAPWLSETKYFRYPFLHRGDTPEKREAVYDFLRENDYVIASVSIDNDEYVYNQQLVDARARGEELDNREEYIAHMMERTEHFESHAQEKLGRPVKHILLLHMNYINGQYLDDLLQAYREDGWEFISLEQALEDPLYELPDTYVGPRGLSYLERIE